MKKPSTFHLSFLFFLLFFIIASSTVSGGTSGRKLLNFPNISWEPNGGGGGNPTRAYGPAHGPNWNYNWGWGSSPGSDWGYAPGSSRSPTEFEKGYRPGSVYGSGGDGAYGGGYWSKSGYNNYGSGDNGGRCGGSGGNEYRSPTTTIDKNKHE